MNLSDVLSDTAERQPDDPAILYEGETRTFRELDDEATRVAGGLAGLGVEPGDRVALWLPNHPVFAAALYGAWRIGAVVVPVHSLLTPTEAGHILRDSGARVALCGAEQNARTGDALSSVEHVVVLDGGGDETLSYQALLDGSSGSVPAVELAEDHLALIAYTSGTLGLPKGAMLTHRNLRANLEQMRSSPVAVRAGDVALCILPLFHIYGLNVVLNRSVELGVTLVVLERFDAADTLRVIREQGVTVVAAAPPAYVAWLSLEEASAEDFRTVRVAVSGAAPLPREVLEGFRDRFGVTIWEGYGLTETSPGVSSTAMGGVPKPGSIGVPLEGVEVRLVDAEGEDVEPGDPGEIVVRGPNVFHGYWQRPEETERVMRGGWFHTGDVAVADDEGYLFLVDRRRDLILVSGFNVYPREVENALREHPAVADAAVVGAPDPETGERVQAYVVLDEGEQASPDQLLGFCEERLAPYKVPAAIEVTAEIPRNVQGKVLRRVLKD